MQQRTMKVQSLDNKGHTYCLYIMYSTYSNVTYGLGIPILQRFMGLAALSYKRDWSHCPWHQTLHPACSHCMIDVCSHFCASKLLKKTVSLCPMDQWRFHHVDYPYQVMSFEVLQFMMHRILQLCSPTSPLVSLHQETSLWPGLNNW